MKKSKQRDWPSFFKVWASWSGVLVGAATLLVVVTHAVFCLSGCATAKHTNVPTYEQARAQANKEAPFVLPPIEARQKLKCADKPIVVKKNLDAGVPHTGLLITNDKASCMVAQRAERDRLRVELDAERLRARTKQIINDAAYKRLVEESKRTWWDRHGGGVLFATGAAVGMAIVMGVLYALTGGKSVNTTTNTHIFGTP